jgi:hypothetical protein
VLKISSVNELECNPETAREWWRRTSFFPMLKHLRHCLGRDLPEAAYFALIVLANAPLLLVVHWERVNFEGDIGTGTIS